MQIRKLSLKEHSMTRPLYESVFSEDSKGFVDYYYTEKTKDNQIYVAEEDGGIRSMLHLNPYKLSVNENKKDANYIVAVATEEEYRKRGYMAALIKAALHDMYEEGQSFTFLMPAAERIYLPHDFRTVYEQDMKFYKGELPECGEKCLITEAGQEYEVTVAEESDCAKLAESANQYLKEHYQVFALRDEAYYQRLRKEYESDGGKLMVYRQNGTIVNCALYVPEDEGEMANTDHIEGAEYVKTAEQTEAAEHKPKIMIRIVDVRRMLMSLSLKSLMAVCFHITDPIIEENNRCISIAGTEFSGVMLMEGKAENSEGIITIAALSSLIFGAKTVEEVCEEEGVNMTERMKAELEKIIPLSHIYLNEIV